MSTPIPLKFPCDLDQIPPNEETSKVISITYEEKLFVPFFLQNLTTFFFGSKQLGSISRLFSEMANEQKANLKRLVN